MAVEPMKTSQAEPEAARPRGESVNGPRRRRSRASARHWSTRSRRWPGTCCRGGGALDAKTLEILRRLEAGERPGVTDLAEAHSNLSVLVAPATPRAIRSLQHGTRTGGWSVLFGPTPPIRRLTAANLFFAMLFFGLSLTPTVNHETIALSIYDQSGLPLFTKLIFLLAAAGLGASFGALFEVWQEIAEGRFDPITESTHWMRIGLGLVAGLILSEVGRTSSTTDPNGGAAVMAEPILALVGGFSARLLHMIVNRIIIAVESTFEPSGWIVTTPREGRPPHPPAGLPVATGGGTGLTTGGSRGRLRWGRARGA